jgi:hypothetical protein
MINIFTYFSIINEEGRIIDKAKHKNGLKISNRCIIILSTNFSIIYYR